MTTKNRNAGKPIVRDLNGKYLYAGDRVTLHGASDEGADVAGVLKYDPAFWAYAMRGDDGKRYLLMDNLHTSIDPGDGGFAWKEIEALLD